MHQNNSQEVFIEKFYDSALRKEDTPFTQIYNFVVQNLLNHEALVIWIYLQTKPPSWKVNRNELLTHFVDMGRDKIEKCLAVLKAVGLIEIYSIREGGKIVGWETYVKCGIGCEEKINKYKIDYLKAKEEKKNKKSKSCQNPETQGSGDNQNTEIQGSGGKVKIPHKIRPKGDIHQIPEIPGSGELGYIERKSDHKEREKERNTTTRERVEGECVPFDSFWNLYPHHFPSSEKTCRSIWVNRKLDSIAPTIIEAVTKFLATDFRWIGSHAPAAKTFLLQDMWTLEPMVDSKIKKEQHAKQEAEQQRIANEKRIEEQSKFSEEKYQRQKEEQYKRDAEAFRAISKTAMTKGTKEGLNGLLAALGAKSKFSESIE